MNYAIFNNSVQIDESISGSYEFLRSSDGHTGTFNLIGAGFASYLNTEGIGVNGVLNVTGSQQVEGNITGYSYNHLSNLVVTGDVYLNKVTGSANFNDLVSTGETDISQFVNGINTSGDAIFEDNLYVNGNIRGTGDLFIDGVTNINGNIFSTGDLDITGTFAINGSGLNDFFSVGVSIGTGDAYAPFQEGKGQLIVGTGAGTGVVLSTGAAESGWRLVYNPANEFGLEWQAPSGAAAAVGGGASLTGFYGATTTYIAFTDGSRWTKSLYPDTAGTQRTDLNVNVVGAGAIFFGPTGDSLDPSQPKRSRGAYSVDFQLADNYESITGEATGAAIGHYSSIGGGSRNTAGSNYSKIGGGLRNAIDGDSNLVDGIARTNSEYSFIGAGRDNLLISSTRSTILGGYSNKISSSADAFIIGSQSTITSANSASIIGSSNTTNTDGDNSTAIGTSNQCQSQYSTAIGFQGKTTRYGEIGISAGRFAANGDAKTSIIPLRRATTDATQSEMFINGVSQRISIETDSTSTFSIYICGQQDATSGGSAASYKIEGCIKNIGGTTSLVGSITKTVIAEDVAGWDVTAEADNTNNALVVKVTGAAATNIRWTATAILTETTYS